MKHILLSIFLLCSLISKANPIQGLLERIDKGAGDKFETELVNSKKDFFELSQDKDKIFARFFQADNQEKKGSLFSGTGIGLALTRTIVEKHHGEITVKSVVGEGSTFTVRLPRRKDVFLNDKNVQFYTQDSESDIIPDSMPVFVDEGNSPIELIETKDTENKTHTVLLVEDNDELLQVLKELFEPFYKIICAHDGKEGLSQIYENSPDLVISDVMMPEMTGTEMCLQIKNI